jgi:2,4-didehydro-3-deoxy-L-rhamnonate hydrolase
MPFQLANVAGRAALVSDNRFYDLERVTNGALGSDVMEAIRRYAELPNWHALLSADTKADGELASADLRAVVPTPKNCFAVGLNYGTHAAESGMELPANPLVFTKFPSCLVGPNDDVVLNSAATDYEVELVVVIGIGGRNITTADAWTHVAGVTMGQDISDRALQFAAKPPHFDLGKSRDTYGPIGPVLTSVDSFADPNDIALRCSINGETRQSDTTANLIFNVPTLIAYLSSILTLSPGDVIFTGTPDGVGGAKGVFLQPGDVIESTIDGVGTMTNRCIA